MAHILLAEDDSALRDFVRRVLEHDGHEVMTTHDGGEAAQALQSGLYRFDLVLADIDMPVMDGIALALKAARDWPHVPVVLMTGYGEHHARTTALEGLIDQVLSKPFTLETVTAAVHRALTAPDRAETPH